MNTPPSECDLAIPNLKSSQDEIRAGEVLKWLPGIDEVRIVSGGIWIAYRSDAVSPQAICEALGREGFRASIYQDSVTGRTGTCSQ